MDTSETKHTIELARELIDDVELSRLQPEQLLLKASRLARLVANEPMQRWLRFELNGYSRDGADLMTRIGRSAGPGSEQLWAPLAALSATIATLQAQIQQISVPNINFSPSSANPNEMVTGFGGFTAGEFTKAPKLVLEHLNTITAKVGRLTAIRSRALSWVHEFAAKTYYQLAFSSLAGGIFAQHKGVIDELLSVHASEVLEKLPAVYDRLREDEPESISQALNTVRRMIGSFADAVYPPAEGSRVVNGETYEIGSAKTLNRIKLYLIDRCPSKSRSERLSKNLRQIHERASAGSHEEVSSDEARSLFLQAYLTLGEILQACATENVAAERTESSGDGGGV